MFIDDFSRKKPSDLTVARRGVAVAMSSSQDNHSKRGKGKKP